MKERQMERSVNDNPAGGYAGKSVAITGGAGYLATNLVHALKETNCRITRIDLPDAKFEVAGGRAQIIDFLGDIRKSSTWERAVVDADVIFHFAAQTSTYVANADPVADAENSVLPLLRLLELCRERGWHKTIVFSSTVTVAGIPSRTPVDETFAENPVTIYDLHKLIAEQYLKYFTRMNVVSGIILRLANVYGPGPRSSRPDRGVLNQMTRRALDGKTLTVYGRGEQLRDYVHVEDVVAAFLQAGLHVDLLKGEHFIIGSGQGYSIAQAMNLIADRVALKTGRRVDVVHIDPPEPLSPIEFRNFVADPQRFRNLTGWRATYTLTRGIDRTIERLL
ncbi:MAG TPA: NAD-dependent epimerase/dehydratase family protein [Smithellaceae bacterium]|nr:NAD-dependent epimerase/dehydratase family protein [Smithellaceae bacterium]